MPGRLRASFRSGNLTEDLGLLLLKGIAAVADVPRTEDVGIDAIATLLRRDQDGNYYAEDGFIVQLKSDSETSLEYRDHQLTWFLAQTHPMFIGVVCRKDARISLYPTLNANQAALALDAKQVKLIFGPRDGPVPWCGGPSDSADVWLGPPLLSWTLADIDDPAWLPSAYAILKRFLAIARGEYIFLSFGHCSKVLWLTNDEHSITSHAGMLSKAPPEDLQSCVNRCIPGLNALFMRSMAMRDNRGNALTMLLFGVVASLRELGVDIDDWTNALATMSVLGLSGNSPRVIESADSAGPSS